LTPPGEDQRSGAITVVLPAVDPRTLLAATVTNPVLTVRFPVKSFDGLLRTTLSCPPPLSPLNNCPGPVIFPARVSEPIGSPSSDAADDRAGAG